MNASQTHRPKLLELWKHASSLAECLDIIDKMSNDPRHLKRGRCFRNPLTVLQASITCQRKHAKVMVQQIP